MVNSVTISGNLTRDIELRATPSGYPVGGFSVAVNERRKQQDGSWEDYPNYFDCTLLGDRAQKLQQYLAKGTKVTVSGKLRQRRWNDKETGKARSAVEIVVDGLEFMSRRDEGAQQAPQAYAPQAYQPAPQQAPQGYQPQPAPQAYAPQQAYQPAPQQAPQAAPQQAAMPVYDADIPF